MCSSTCTKEAPSPIYRTPFKHIKLSCYHLLVRTYLLSFTFNNLCPFLLPIVVELEPFSHFPLCGGGPICVLVGWIMVAVIITFSLYFAFTLTNFVENLIPTFTLYFFHLGGLLFGSSRLVLVVVVNWCK